jgi:nucleoside-diphosphate-sugar epimerase
MGRLDFPSAYVVTGALGWCGRRLVRLLATGFDCPALAAMPRPERIRCAVLPGQDAADLRALGPGIELVECDVRSAADCRRLVAGIGGATLIHTAGVIHPRRVADFFAINRDGTRRLVAAAAAAGLPRAVVISSNAPIGCNPHRDHVFDESSPYAPCLGYGRSKMEMEQALAAIHATGRIEVVIIRPPWFYGPDQPPRQTLFFRMIKEGRVPIVGDGTNRRSMVYVDNLAQALVLAAASTGVAGRTYWIADGRPYPMTEIIDTIERVLERDFGVAVAHGRLRLPGLAGGIARAADASLQALGLYHQKVHVLAEMDRTIACDVGKARRELGYEPTITLEEGMRRSIQDLLDRGLSP